MSHFLREVAAIGTLLAKSFRYQPLATLRLRRNIDTDFAMRVEKVVGQIAHAEVLNVVRAGAAGRAIQLGGFPHSKSNGVIRARGVSAHP